MTMPEQKPGRSKQDYSTPADFITAVKAKLQIDQFDFDFAADATNAKAARWFNEQADALSYTGAQWADQIATGWHWGWLNPPFSQIEPWAVRCSAVRDAGRFDRVLGAVGGGQQLVSRLGGRACEGAPAERPHLLRPEQSDVGLSQRLCTLPL